MTETSGRRGSTSPKTVTNSEPRRGRGRPPGSKNKPKVTSIEVVAVVKKGRGRPKGAKNKSKDEQKPILQEPKKRERNKPEQPTVVLEEPKKRRGRPPKVKTEQPQVELAVVEDKLKDHPLLEAVKWIEKSMHHTEVHYYRSRANKAGVSLHVAMASDILGFFNVQDPEINKQIKKNNFIAITHHGIHQ